MSKFSLPPNADTYIYTVKDRCMDLIRHNIWNGIRQDELNRWFGNFNNDLEYYFAACILDALIYRSSDQVTSLGNELFTKKLPLCLNKCGHAFVNYRDLLDLLKSQPTNELRLVSVTLKNERPVKSSNVVLRDFRRKIGLNDNWFIHPAEVKTELKNGVNTFIFIDDFLGTGSQFEGMYKENGFELLLSNANSIYSPLVAHETGIKFLNDKCGSVQIVSAEFLNKELDVFSFAFNDDVNNGEIAKEFYDSLLDKYKFDLLDKNKYGFGNLGLAYTFYHSAPDNCLNILWDDKNGWYPLIKK
ncbi:hypothetical protein [Winogradskyella sp.]|uniref:phosphoribosyltransferase-like protein n=1 Tax=Winogradskyella sp. TaxID=1883156 RepID=UPI0025F0BD8B|nr:hypothetical protein [Winogradskyella sp.]